MPVTPVLTERAVLGALTGRGPAVRVPAAGRRPDCRHAWSPAV